MFAKNEIDADKKKLALEVVKSLYTMLFQKFGIGNYRIEPDGKFLRLRESTSIQVSADQRDRIKNKVEDFVVRLKKIGLLEDYQKIRLKESGFDIYVFKLEINFEKIIQLFSISKPANVALEVWNAMPEEIQIRWDRFSKDMQSHILDCIKPATKDQLGALLSTRIFSDSVRDPIMATVPKIPVRFKENQADQFLDLLDVLKIVRSPVDGKRHNPFNRAAFELNELVPARDKFERIKEQAAQIKPPLF